MNQEPSPVDNTSFSAPPDRIPFGLWVAIVGLLIMVLGAKPAWFGLDHNSVVGFIQIIVFLIGLAIICLGGYMGLNALWNGDEKSIVADIGIRLVSTGYVIALFSGMSDVFGMTVQNSAKTPFFGPWQEAGMELGLIIILAGVLMVIPYHRFINPHSLPKS